MEFSHELIMPNEDLPFKMFLFEGKDGNYVRDKHWHRSIEIFAVFEGELRFFMNAREYPLAAGTFILVNSNEIHSVESPDPNFTIVLQIPLKAFENYYSGEPFIWFSHEACPLDMEIMELLRHMFYAYQEKNCGYELKVLSGYYNLLYLLVTQYREQSVSQDMLRCNRKLNRLSMITSYIKDNYDAELSLETLAEIFGYSPSYLSRMFQKYAGVNYKDYLQNIRVEHARQEIINTEDTISEIAQYSGFSDSRALAKAFRKKYGILPSDYRNKKRQKSAID